MEGLRSYEIAAPRRFAAALAAVTNEITRRTPAPRDFPFFGLDHPQAARAELLERLSELGIFRFYERVLDVDAGLGGPARWLARRRGCSVVSLGRGRERAAASRLLVRRAHLESAVAVGVAALDCLPAADASFTHAWSVGALAAEPDKSAVFAELRRVVRPGGHVALQEWTRAAGAPPLACGLHEPLEAYLGGLRAAGFSALRTIAAEDVGDDGPALAAIVAQRVLDALGSPESAERRAFEAADAIVAERAKAVAERRISLVQIFAERPA